MQNPAPITAGVNHSTVEVNKLMRNTYMLLSITLIFSAITAFVAIATNAAPLGLMGFIGMLGLLFAVQYARNTVWALPLVFAFTGFMGYTLGPLINFYLSLQNGGQIVATALSMTGIIFLGLSAYVITTKKDFTFLRGMLIAGLLIVVVAVIANIFLAIPALSLALSAVIVMLMSGFILYDTSRMIKGGETNYVMMTVSLYLSIYNLFTALLHLIGAFSSND